MKKNSKYIALTAAFLALFSCTQEEFLPQNVGKDVPIALSTVEVEGTLTTRATTTVLTEGTVGLFVKDNSEPNNPDYNARNCHFKYIDGKWEFVADNSHSRPLYNYIPEYEGSRQIAWTYSPYIEDIDNPAPFELQAIQTAESIAAQEKYLFAWEPVFVGRNSMVSICMKHALSKVRVNIKEILPADVSTTSIESVSLGNMLDKLAWDFSLESHIGFKVPDGATYTGTTNMYKVSDTEYEAVVLPSEKDGKFEIALKTSNGRTFTAQVDYPTRNNKTGFESNYIYTIDLVVGVEKITIASTKKIWNKL